MINLSQYFKKLLLVNFFYKFAFYVQLVFIFFLFEIIFNLIFYLFTFNFLFDIILLLFFFILFLIFIPSNEVMKIKKYALIFSIIIFVLTLFL